MELVRWTPWGRQIRPRTNFDRLFNDFFAASSVIGDRTGAVERNWNPAVDVYEEETHYVVKAELPGIDKEDISIDVTDGVMTLSGERKVEEETKEDGYFRREMSYGKFERAFRLPADVNTEDIRADYKDGVLKIEVPKPEEKKPKSITVH